ncbi:serine hydrolase domain-containing protein [Actinophytocola gossypii]|uniref:Beta-lactamase family protein n=1 Tax=Actinophytocola gossypii TaxID=2812003 RepID=A0ABT2J3H8_9PSEU|nr:serine hydrolase domain-containing protein [Actinophytocola gossypii]MCT2582348.1 beta-lactamase family protein [Actinophytocola gossypii]
MTRKITRWLVTAALTATAGTAFAAPAQAADHPDTQTVLDQYLLQAGPGAAVYAGDGTESWTVASGTSRFGANRPIEATDHFRIASQTKTFVATTVLRLVDEGLVDLDAPIETYLPGVVGGEHYDGNAISVRQLLQHTSGIARDAINAQANPDGTFDLAELVRAGLAQAPQFAPGTGYGYSNINYHVLGMLIEAITGQPYADAVADLVIEPLGLTATSVPAPGDRSLPDPYVHGYQGVRIGSFQFWIETTSNLEMTYAASAGAMTSTLTDLATFHSELDTLLSPASLAEMRTTVPGAHNLDYGLGIMRLNLSCGGEAWGHAGNLTTGHSSVTMVTDDGRYASMTTNTFPAGENAPTRYDVLGTALCEA